MCIRVCVYWFQKNSTQNHHIFLDWGLDSIPWKVLVYDFFLPVLFCYADRLPVSSSAINHGFSAFSWVLFLFSIFCDFILVVGPHRRRHHHQQQQHPFRPHRHRDSFNEWRENLYLIVGLVYIRNAMLHSFWFQFWPWIPVLHSRWCTNPKDQEQDVEKYIPRASFKRY